MKTLLYWASLMYMKVFRWKREGKAPGIPKYVMIAAPHTSNWDLPITLILAFALRIKIFWLGKHSIFEPPFGHICRWLGGIPVDRRRSGDTVSQAVQTFNNRPELILVVPPEGTRKKVRYWKTGFYYIALGACVPIVLGFVDYKRKAGGIGPTIMPTGDIGADMAIIQEYYKNIIGKNAEQWNCESAAINK
ncbi:MAG: lysophospholipid acyltransferase family protein [Syntrophales bacterium]|nr:lysophospholipid acyltransferase family protein [Syntrophales bacterium]